jgi:flagellar hook-basal body complex protein FliE
MCQEGSEMIAIDSGKIEAMVAQMRSSVSTIGAPTAPVSQTGEAGRVDFAQVFKAQMDQVNTLQKQANDLGERFSLGDDSVSLSDVMIASQKSGIAMQTTQQIRNQLVSAYKDIMNMQV